MALGSYSEFIRSMLGLREQRLQEERYKQLERMEQQEQMSKMMAGMGKQFGNMAETMGQNQTANQLMNEYFPQPPRAQAVSRVPETTEYAPGIGAIRSGGGYVADPAMQRRADIVAQGMQGFYTGGAPELKMRMAMEEFANKRGDKQFGNLMDLERLKLSERNTITGEKGLMDRAERNALLAGQAESNAARAEASLALAQEKEARMQEAQDVDQAMKARQLVDDNWKKDLARVNSYNADLKVAMKALGHAKNEREYNAAVSSAESLWQVAAKNGLKVERPIFEPYTSTTQLEKVRQEQQALEGLRKQVAEPNLLQRIGIGDIEPEEILRKETEIKAMPGYEQAQPGYRPPEQPEGVFAPIPPAPEIPDIMGIAAKSKEKAAAGGPAPANAAVGEISLAEAQKIDPRARVGGYIRDKFGNRARIGP